ncbi:MAG TPA: class IV adenylate cyclase [Acidobacteriaceae bacterium]
MAVEIELKFSVDNLPALTLRLHELGFHLDTPRTFESNTLYDTPGRTLLAGKQLLRIRQYGDIWTLTHKLQPSEFTPDDVRYKRRIETETTVADGEILATIFASLGYTPVFRYEKFRAEWSDPATGGHIVLDETPIGTFAELEGEPAWIDATLLRLNIPAESCTTESYGKLFLAWKERTHSEAEHLTFDAIR